MTCDVGRVTCDLERGTRDMPKAERRAERRLRKQMDASAKRSYMVAKIIERTQRGMAKALGKRGHQEVIVSCVGRVPWDWFGWRCYV